MATKQKLPSGMIQRGDVYHANFRTRGRQVRKRLDRNLTLAKQLLTEYRHRANAGDFSFLDGGGDLESLKLDYLADCRLRLEDQTMKSYERSLAQVFETMHFRRLSQLTIKSITQYRTRRLQDRGKGRLRTTGPATINREIAILKAMMNWGVKHGYIDKNPIAQLAKLPEHDRRKLRRPLTPEEADSVLQISLPHEHDAFLTLLCTGLRSDELCSLLTSDVDLASRLIVVRREVAKSHKSREIPIAAPIFEMLERRVHEARKVGVELVFTNRHGRRWLAQTLLENLRRRCRQAGINDAERGGSVDIHALRGTYATEAIANGADPKAVQSNLGHSSLDLTMRIYAKATDQSKRAAVDCLPFGKQEKPAADTSKVTFPLRGVHNSCTDRKTALENQNAATG